MDSIIYEDREMTDERLELTSKEGNYYLGPNLTLRNCTVVTRVVARWLNILPSCFIDCTIEVKRELKNMDWLSAELKGCRFTGRLTGLEFGHWPDYATGRETGSIADCDFSEARLDDCRFHGCDMRTIRLPRWPCFTLLDPNRNAREVARVQWPGTMHSFLVNILADQPPSTVAVSFYAPSLARGCKTTPEALKPLLEQFDCFVL